MQLNGKSINVNDIFSKDMLNNLPEDLPTNTSEISVDLRQINIISNIPARYSSSRFGEFDYPFLQNLIKLSVEPEDKMCILFGGVGVGKTTLLSSAIHERGIKGLEAGLYFNMRMLLPILRTSRSFTAKENEEMLLRRLCTVPFLCLDEVGVCQNLKEESEFLTTVYCQRFDNNLSTWTATNLSPLNFKLLLCGINGNEIVDGKKELVEKLEKENPTLNRVMSVAVGYVIQGDSHRGRL